MEEDPIPPVGDIQSYFSNNIVYPEIARKVGIEGTVFVSFWISKDGRVRAPKILKGIGYGCDEEAIRVIKEMPRWKPGKNGGKPVKVRLNIPVVFKL